MIPYAVRDLPAEAYPFTVDFIDQTGKVVHTITIEGPGVTLIPALRDQYGPVDVRITYADHTVIYEKARQR